MEIPLFVSSGKRAVAILSPYQERLIYEHLNSDYKIRTRFLLHTGMRIAEAKWVDHHRDCFRKANGIILLPKVEEIGKKQCKITNRAVLLSHAGILAVEDFFDKNVHFPSYQAMEQALKLAATEANIDKTYINPKMYRKTLISLLMACYPEKEAAIAASCGHTIVTMRGHYLGAGFTKEDKKEIQSLFWDWGDAR